MACRAFIECLRADIPTRFSDVPFLLVFPVILDYRTFSGIFIGILLSNFTFIPLTLYPRRGSRGISNIAPRRPQASPCFRRTESRWLHLQSLVPTNPHWARVMVYDPFSLCVINKEGLCPSSEDVNRLMMMNFHY
jgi:hypothetical protein